MHLCLDADRILLQYEILEGHTQLTHLHFMLPPFCRLSLCLWGSAHINSNLDGASRWVRAFANQKAMSGAPIRIGTNQLPNPPIIAGIIIKKIIKKA